ncbi:LLM class flavin-dependent oxidoreductase [Candidatus Mycolicibacterium alkanivorans]|uniref:LLM class flavin-dependent oxidoreductase n=1 Tax=Candidatus Mycolicibacterium alkanivorans TaxID=2954114 RepID=A0ABS9YR34_9MYCO|nr:LLM class flavin-dependent oxidoreductase [Candidatus Mycolicibacterium alkanivorans]MCI4673700.1 LLM class flavin-dependent oxidoreductase [Candidatus Mycolicibacterium alkanivorans]
MALNPVYLGVALDGYGCRPQAMRYTPAAEPVTSGRHWARLAAIAERGMLDFLTVEDNLGTRGDTPRADAVLIAARIAPVTRNIGLIPVATVTHTEPFHISKAIATLDYVSHGRAGWQPRVSATAAEAELFGRRAAPAPDESFDEAADFVEVVRRLWDSWEDDAVIRDVATGRYVDRNRLHYIDFTGRYFSVKGPSITPRPPQGQPVVAALAHAERVYEFASAAADVVFVTPKDEQSLARIVGEVNAAGGQDLKVIADLVVDFGGASDVRSDALVWGGTPAELADLLLAWHDLGLDGFRLRPAVNTTDLPAIVDDLVPVLQRAGRFRTAYRDGETLRERLGLPVAVNRYTPVRST